MRGSVSQRLFPRHRGCLRKQSQSSRRLFCCRLNIEAESTARENAGKLLTHIGRSRNCPLTALLPSPQHLQPMLEKALDAQHGTQLKQVHIPCTEHSIGYTQQCLLRLPSFAWQLIQQHVHVLSRARLRCAQGSHFALDLECFLLGMLAVYLLCTHAQCTGPIALRQHQQATLTTHMHHVVLIRPTSIILCHPVTTTTRPALCHSLSPGM